MAKLPWFRFEATTWLSDSHVRLMSAQQRGWYIDLLCWAWQEGGFELRRAEGLCQFYRDVDECNEDISMLRADFQDVLDHFTYDLGDGIVSHPKLEEFRSQVQDKSERQSLAGRSTQAKLAAKLDGKHSTRQAIRASESLSSSEYSEVKLEAKTKTSTRANGHALNPLVARYQDFLALYPNPTQSDEGCRQWISMIHIGEITDENVAHIFEGLERWKVSRQWANGKRHAVPNWLRGKMWRDHPEPQAKDALDD